MKDFTNVVCEIDADTNILTVLIDLNEEHGMSKSGLSKTVASTHGNISLEGTNVKLNINCYKPDKAAKEALKAVEAKEKMDFAAFKETEAGQAFITAQEEARNEA